MKRLKISAFLISLVAIGSIACANVYGQDPTGMPSDDGMMIYCNCTRDISTKPQSCAANNHGSSCHGSINAKCWEYNGNCK